MALGGLPPSIELHRGQQAESSLVFRTGVRSAHHRLLTHLPDTDLIGRNRPVESRGIGFK
jgi:hypothetical protein